MIPRWLKVLLFLTGSILAAWFILFLYVIDRGIGHD